MIAPGPQGRNGILIARRRVAESDGDIAQPAFVADAADRAAFGVAVEFFLGPGEQLRQAGAAQAMAFVEIGQHGALGKLVPGAGGLAVVGRAASQRWQSRR